MSRNDLDERAQGYFAYMAGGLTGLLLVVGTISFYSLRTPSTHTAGADGVCQVEKSTVAGGQETIYYPPGHAVTVSGTRVPCKPPCEEDEACWNWRTMGNHSHGVCKNVSGHLVDQIEWLEDDGTLTYTDGGRACEANPAAERCTDTNEIIGWKLPIPSGWSFTCPVENLRYGSGNGAPVNGLTDPKTKSIKIADPGGMSQHKFEGIMAHEICHARLMAAGDPSQSSSDYFVIEKAADACAARAGFPVERSVTEGFGYTNGG